MIVPCNFAFSDTAGYSRIFLQQRRDTIIPLIYAVFPEVQTPNIDTSQAALSTFTGNLFTLNFEDGYLDVVRYENGQAKSYHIRDDNQVVHFRNCDDSDPSQIFVSNEGPDEEDCFDFSGGGGGGFLDGFKELIGNIVDFFGDIFLSLIHI